jgi:membrane dipeptidase
MDDGLIPIFDGHNDMLLRLATGGTFLEQDSGGHLDLPRARRGGLAGGFCAVFVHSHGNESSVPTPTDPLTGEFRFPATPTFQIASAVALATMARLFRLERASAGSVRIVHSAQEIEDCIEAGVFAALLHLEGAEAIDPDFDALEVFHRAGLRSLGLVWSRPNPFGHGVPFLFPHSPDTGPGLTDAGRQLVRECNRLRILIDLSHITQQGFWDVAEESDAPLVATHSNAHTLSQSTRNLTDRQLDAIRASDGMVGINFCVGFLREDGAPEVDTPLDAIVRHVDYLSERVGIDRVGFGSDFDGAMIPGEIGDAGGLPKIMDALRHRGYSESDLRKIGYQNWIRVLRATWGE